MTCSLFSHSGRAYHAGGFDLLPGCALKPAQLRPLGCAGSFHSPQGGNALSQFISFGFIVIGIVHALCMAWLNCGRHPVALMGDTP